MRNKENFDTFYGASVQRVLGQLHAITGNLPEAEDAVQEAYSRAWQRWGRVARYHDPEAWVRVVAYRIFVSSWRKAATRAIAQQRHGPPPEERGINSDYVAIVSALRQIPVDQRHAIVLYHLVGRSVDQIADEARVSSGTVKARLSRGRRALAGLLSEDLPADLSTLRATGQEEAIHDA